MASKAQIKIAVIGEGPRGQGLTSLLAEMPDVDIMAVCDLYEDRVKTAQELVVKAGKPEPKGFTDYKKVLKLKGLQAIITPSSWQSHVQICIDAMEAGLYVGTEVGGAYSIQQCWDLVHTSERTGMPCMLLENCCYGREELTILRMIRKGLFGEVVHAEGGNRHDLRDEICLGAENRHYRLNNFKHRNAELYPTHELGPIAKYFNINRGNRMLTLTSTASKSVGLTEWAEENKKKHPAAVGGRFAAGDVVTTVIKCAQGQTIVLYHDCSLYRPYSRCNLLQGTKGIWMEDKHSVAITALQEKPEEGKPAPHATWKNLDELWDKYEHPLWAKFRKACVTGGHGGMDYLVLRAFLCAVRDKTQTPIDVYDSAAWMSISILSEESIAMGSHPVAVPDFTNGKWIDPRPVVKGCYCLDEDVPIRTLG